MRIKELYIRSFGKLKDYKLSFADGVNVLFGSNEAGKTTIFNFILAMLYGFSNARSKSISDSARKRYMTWGEDRIGGTMTIEHNGVAYVIDRTFSKTKAGDSLKLTNLSHGEQISLANGKEVGEYLFDLDEKSFKGTCLIGQLSKDDVCDNDSVKTKLSNLSSTGDEEYSFDEVFNRLKNASLEITRKSSTGKIYPLEMRKSELENRNRVIESDLNQITTIDDENKALERKLDELSYELSQIEKRISKAEKYRKSAEYKKSLEMNNKIEALHDEYRKTAQDITRNGFTADRGYVDALNDLIKRRDDARLKYEYEKKMFEILTYSKSKNKPSVLPFVLGIVSAILVAMLIFIMLKSIIISVVVFALAVVVIACAYFVFNGKIKVTVKDNQNAVNDSDETLNRLKEVYNTCDNEFAEKYFLFFERKELDRAEENIKSLALTIDRYVEAKSKYDAVKLSAVSQETLEQMRTDIDEADLNNNIEMVDTNELEARGNLIKNELLETEKTLLVNKERVKGKSKLGAELENNVSALSEISEKIKSYQYTGECIELAKQGLKNAQSRTQQQFAPGVSRFMSEILNEITCGKYECMTLNSNLQAMLVDRKSGAAYDDEYMSAGTLDQMYLALRFAMVNLIFADKECPIICMDDALLNFDSERMNKATEYISSVLSKKAQVLFFTCRDTEKECFSASNLINV